MVKISTVRYSIALGFTFICMTLVTLSSLMFIHHQASTVNHWNRQPIFYSVPQFVDFVPVANMSSANMSFQSVRRCYYKIATGEKKIMQKEMRDKNHCVRRLPQVIIIGAPVCGSDLLEFYLYQHPALVFPEETGANVSFFKTEEGSQTRSTWYRNKMAYSSPDQLTVARHDDYLSSEFAPARMQIELIPMSKFIVVLCEPVARAAWEYAKHVKKYGYRNSSKPLPRHHLTYPYYDPHNTIEDSFEKSIFDNTSKVRIWNGLINKGMYVIHFRRWLEYFAKERFLVLEERWLIKNPLKILHKVEKFLGIPSYFKKDQLYHAEKNQFYCVNKPFKLCPVNFEQKNMTVIYSSLNESAFTSLEKFYRPYNRDLTASLQRKFLSWNIQNQRV